MWPLANGKQATRSVDGTKASQAFGGMAVVGVVVVAICVDFCITILTFNYNRKRIMHEIIPFRHDIPATTQMLTQADCKYVYVWMTIKSCCFSFFFLLSTTIKTDDLIFSVLVIDCALKHVRPLNRTTSTGFHFIFGERKTMACKSWMLQSHLRVTGRTLLPKRVCCLVLCCSHFGSVC